jgi:hypothetical protein
MWDVSAQALRRGRLRCRARVEFNNREVHR